MDAADIEVTEDVLEELASLGNQYRSHKIQMRSILKRTREILGWEKKE